MISVDLVKEHISTFPEEEVNPGVIRKYVIHKDTKIYLHPVDPRFGSTMSGDFYSFRRPMGARGTEERSAGVDFDRPRVLKGHKGRNGETMITITPYLKRKKSSMIDEIFQGAMLTDTLCD